MYWDRHMDRPTAASPMDLQETTSKSDAAAVSSAWFWLVGVLVWLLPPSIQVDHLLLPRPCLQFEGGRALVSLGEADLPPGWTAEFWVLRADIADRTRYDRHTDNRGLQVDGERGSRSRWAGRQCGGSEEALRAVAGPSLLLLQAQVPSGAGGAPGLPGEQEEGGGERGKDQGAGSRAGQARGNPVRARQIGGAREVGRKGGRGGRCHAEEEVARAVMLMVRVCGR